MSGPSALYVRETDERALAEIGLGDLGIWKSAIGGTVPRTGRGATAVVATPAGPRWRLKLLRRGGALAPLWRDRYATPRRALGMLRISERARTLGVPTARPVALILESGLAGSVSGAAAFEEIEGSESLAHLVTTQSVTREDVLAAVDAVRLMHDRGIHHRDLNLGNILITRDGSGRPAAWLIDFDRALYAAAPRPFRDRQAALRRLERSCAKLTGCAGPLGPGSEDLWYEFYAGGDGALASRLARGRRMGRFWLQVHRIGWRNER